MGSTGNMPLRACEALIYKRHIRNALSKYMAMVVSRMLDIARFPALMQGPFLLRGIASWLFYCRLLGSCDMSLISSDSFMDLRNWVTNEHTCEDRAAGGFLTHRASFFMIHVSDSRCRLIVKACQILVVL